MPPLKLNPEFLPPFQSSITLLDLNLINEKSGLKSLSCVLKHLAPFVSPLSFLQ